MKLYESEKGGYDSHKSEQSSMEHSPSKNKRSSNRAFADWLSDQGGSFCLKVGKYLLHSQSPSFEKVEKNITDITHICHQLKKNVLRK